MIAPHKYLTYLYASALVVVAGSLIGGQFLIQWTLAESQRDARRINLAGRQRMLSVRAVRIALELQDLPPGEPQQLAKSEQLVQTEQQLQETHFGLLHGDPNLGLFPTQQDSELQYFDRLATPLEQMRSASKQLLESKSPSSLNDGLATMTTAQAEFLPLMDALVERMSHHADQRIVHAKRVELGILLVTLVILACEAWFVFRPAARKIADTIETLRDRERSLIRSEKRQKDLVRHSAGAIMCLHHQTGRITDVNPAAAEQLGLAADQLVGRRFASFLDKSSAESLGDQISRLAVADSCQCQIQILSADSDHREWLIRLSKYRRDDDEPIIVLTAHDVTDQAARERQLIESSQRDALTGLYNRGEFDRRIESMSRLHQMQGIPFTLGLIDIDHFKTINDKFGHQSGDEVLRTIARIVESACRSADVVARYGGEEIAVLFPSLAYRDAEPIANRIRRTLEGSEIMAGEGDDAQLIHATVCIGIAGAPSHSTDGHDLVAYADAALYTAKRSGRNCVVVATSAEAEIVAGEETAVSSRCGEANLPIAP